MREIVRNCDIFDNLFGLSCVENLLLYILKANCISYQALYYDSFITISDIEAAFIDKNESYSSFEELVRVQDIALAEGIIKIHQFDGNTLPEIDNSTYCCAMVSPEFVADKLKSKLWRKDHYILLSPADNGDVYYINDSPRHIGLMTIEELFKYYSGRAIGIEIAKSSAYIDIESYVRKLSNRIHLDDETYEIRCKDLLSLRDIVGILRISRKRIHALLSLQYNVDFMESYLRFIDKSYSILEYMRLRNQYDIHKIFELKEQIKTNDDQTISDIITYVKI